MQQPKNMSAAKGNELDAAGNWVERPGVQKATHINFAVSNIPREVKKEGSHGYR
jgi:hypothetical protein